MVSLPRPLPTLATARNRRISLRSKIKWLEKELRAWRFFFTSRQTLFFSANLRHKEIELLFHGHQKNVMSSCRYLTWFSLMLSFFRAYKTKIQASLRKRYQKTAVIWFASAGTRKYHRGTKSLLTVQSKWMTVALPCNQCSLLQDVVNAMNLFLKQ